MKAHELGPPAGAVRKARRVGRGRGSGSGKTAGRGSKGQKARSGGQIPTYFEGGQLPLVRKLPYRRGFKNPFRVEYAVANLDQLDRFPADAEITPEQLRKGSQPLKILARGQLTKPVRVEAHAFSRAARAAIEAAGGTIVELKRD